ncbi:hypothetical protein TSUD_02800 [Trifolium subterraneum]|uniref:Leucine-rich repeat-containing N-terminal plant-type domain-containing protein n=1 Tax=Trifolium subterraneum TaxID=3900 RepID=A0A2Z6NC05_TRISU|nr:hypothetical protein TSUD_02800 [Trifolium subterraneum]
METTNVKCAKGGRVLRYHVPDLKLYGYFAQDTLVHLDQLERLSLRNNSLFGLIPDLSQLINLKSLFLDNNNFSRSFRISILFLHRLVALSLDHNNLTGSLPMNLTLLDRLILLHLESNHFSGLLPPINQTYLKIFYVSANNLTGPIPLTPTLYRFKPASFSENPGLCGEIVRRPCDHDHDHHSSAGFIVIMVILDVAFAAVVVIVVIKRKPVATGFGVLKQQVEMV